MNKPVKKKVREDMIYYHEMIDYIEQKYKIDTRDYLSTYVEGKKISSSMEHFLKFQKEENDPQPYENGKLPGMVNGKFFIYKNGEKVFCKKEEYLNENKKIVHHYERYNKWLIDNPKPEYQDFWHWIIDNTGASMGRDAFLPIVEWIEDENTPSWVKQISTYIKQEFESEFKYDGLNVWIEYIRLKTYKSFINS